MYFVFMNHKGTSFRERAEETIQRTGYFLNELFHKITFLFGGYFMIRSFMVSNGELELMYEY